MSAELQVAIQNMTDSDVTLSGLVLQTDITGGRGVWFDQSPNEVQAPWVSYYIISEGPDRVFDSNDDGEEVIVQFSIFDTNSTTETTWAVNDAIVDLFDRKEITYSTREHVACTQVFASGPTKNEDGWMRTLDFRIVNEKSDMT